MKKALTSIATSILITLSASGQDIQASTNGNSTMTASAGYEYPKPAESVRWKEERVNTRREFYAAKTSFDPSAEYETLYHRSASSSLDPVTERGTVKLMDGNNKAQIVYYNKAVVGTVLKLTNPNNGKTSYAIVIGKIPPAESESCMIKLSEKVAKNLELKDYASIEVIGYTPRVHKDIAEE